MNRWWGYIHINGQLKVKPYYSHADLVDALQSEFVTTIFKPFWAENGEDAAERLRYPFRKAILKDGFSSN